MLATLSFLLLAAAAPHVRSITQPEVRLGEVLALRVDNLPADQCKSLVLFIDGLPIAGVPPDCSHAGEVRYTLALNDKNAAAWHVLFSRAPGCCRNVSVSAGTGIQQIATDVVAEPMRIINRIRWLITILVLLLAIVAILVLRWRTTLLSNLPRMQVACFAVAILAAYGYIWSTTGELATLNASALGLLGVGAGTAIGNAILASGKRVSVSTVGQTIANDGIEAPVETQVIFGLHYMQAAVWTAVICVIFVAFAYRWIEMPDLDSRVLLLLGISGGTYLALSFKRQ